MSSSFKNIEFWATIVVGGLLLGFALLIGDLKIQVATVGLYVTLLLGLVAADLRKAESIESSLVDSQDIGLEISKDPDVKEFYDNSVQSLCKVFQIRDSVFLRLVRSRLKEFRLELATELSMGMISFRAEAWRVHYQEILGQPDVIEYKSVAFVKSENYWHDETGKYSIQFNYELLKKRKSIERIFIIRDSVWNSTRIKDWIREQKDKGIVVGVARESRIPPEEDLLYDLGIYGDRAVGYQTMNDDCKTTSFQFHFNKDTIEKTKEQFERLKIHTLLPSELEDYLNQTGATIARKAPSKAVTPND